MLDTTFANNANVFPATYGEASTVLIQTDQKIVVCGSTYTSDIINSCAAVIRLNNDVLGMEGFNKDEVSVFPNPSTGVVHIDNTNNGFKSVQVYNSIGQLISTQTLGVTASANIDLSGYSKGVYLLNFQGEKGGKSCKVVKE